MTQNNGPVPPEMRHLMTKEGLSQLKDSMEPISLKQGILPFEDRKRETSDIVRRPVESREVIKTRPNRGVVLFTLGPVYWSLKVPFDILEEFLQSEYGKGAFVQRISISKKLLPDVPGWEKMVESINEEAWDNLVLFLSECVFRRTPNYWTLCGDFCTVQLKGGSAPAPVAVFTPRSLTTKMKPFIDENGAIRLSTAGISEPWSPMDDYSRKMTLALDNKE